MPKPTARPTIINPDDFAETVPLIPEPILSQHRCLEPNDTRFTAAARLLQSLWRQDQNLPIVILRWRPRVMPLERSACLAASSTEAIAPAW